MPSSITICQVPDEVRDELSSRAALSGCSVEDYIRAELIALSQRPSAALWKARIRARKDALESATVPCVPVSVCEPRQDVG